MLQRCVNEEPSERFHRAITLGCVLRRSRRRGCGSRQAGGAVALEWPHASALARQVRLSSRLLDRLVSEGRAARHYSDGRNRARERTQMASRRYLNFDLLLEQEGEGRYRARVTELSARGDTQRPVPAPVRRDRAREPAPQARPRPLADAPREAADPRPRRRPSFGGALFEAVFAEEVRLAWPRSQDATRDAGEGLRLRLQLTDAPAIAGLPWELLYDRRTTRTSRSPNARRSSATSRCRSPRGR